MRQTRSQGLGLALQVADEVPEIDIVSSLRMFDADPVGGHHLVRSEEELDPVVIEMGMEAVADEARGDRIGDTVDADGAVAGDVCADQGKIRGSLRRQRLEDAALVIHEPGPASVLLGQLLINEAAVVLVVAGEIALGVGVEVLVGGREGVAAQLGGCASQLPQRILQVLGQRGEALSTQHDR